ncbi:hypothetical protein LINPERHAP1_LOCUS14111 [Linum perenne]
MAPLKFPAADMNSSTAFLSICIPLVTIGVATPYGEIVLTLILYLPNSTVKLLLSPKITCLNA